MSAADFLPGTKSLSSLRQAARDCRGCPLYLRATQTVFGKGPSRTSLMLVGETPGDQEDLQGLPFVGPAGRVLDEALACAGLQRRDIYLTNAVKHFKWEPRGKRRLHAKPSAREIAACRPWLEAEIDVVHPKVIVCMGATASQTLLGRTFRLTQHRGELVKVEARNASLLATYHPSAILRAPERGVRHRMREEFASDLKKAAAAAQSA